MCDESEAYVPADVMPSIHDTDGAAATRTLDTIDARLSRETLSLCCIDGLLEIIKDMGGVDGISLDSFRTDSRHPATITRVGKTYEVRRRRDV